MPDTNARNTLFAAITLIACLELLRTAWIGDDAFITLRTVLNFVHGYGPTFNIDERVQGYTHPLWFLLLSGVTLISKNVFTSTFVLSIGISLCVIWLLLTRVTRNIWAAALAATVLILSKAYVDYSTSGLENPLSHLLILLIALIGSKASEQMGAKVLTGFFLCCSLLYLSRPDLLVLVFPAALLVIGRNRRTPAAVIKALFVGALPIAAWTLFSIYYYGFPFPNTAYAKLGAGIPFDERVVQGLRYLLDTVDRDPLTLAVIAAGVLIGLRTSAYARALSIGSLAYLGYVISIGGDFMSGRFLTGSLLIAVIVLARAELSRQQLHVMGISVALLASVSLNSTLLSGSKYGISPISVNGISDERGGYFQDFGLLTAKPATFARPHWELATRSVAVVCGGLGAGGISQGPGAHFIDTCGLTDPLLARLAAKYNPNWRIGHFIRQLPTDYEESVSRSENLLDDPSTQAYYEAIRTVTRGKLNSLERLKTIVRLNLGRIALPDQEMYRHGIVPRNSRTVQVNVQTLSKIVEDGGWDALGNIQFATAVEVLLDTEMHIKEMDLSLDSNDGYRVEVLVDGHYQPALEITPLTGIYGMARRTYTLDMSSASTRQVRITATVGDGYYSLGHFRVK